MPQVIRSTEGRYDVQEVEEFGRAYRWRPEQVVIECDCGERPTLTSARTACGECGADHTVLIREWLAGTRRRLKGDEVTTHPWRFWHPPESAGIPV
jgi:hypothetical protein